MTSTDAGLKHSVRLFLGSGKSDDRERKRNFLADAMREMEDGGKSLNFDSIVRKVPNVIRVVMTPEVPPKHRFHRRQRKKILSGVASILRLAKGLNTMKRDGKQHKTDLVNVKKAFQETLNLLEKIHGRLESASTSRTNGLHKIVTSTIHSPESKKSKAILNNSFSLFPGLRSIVQHGTFNPYTTRAAFARAKQIVGDSAGRNAENTNVKRLNNSELTKAVALFAMAAKEADGVQSNKMENIHKETRADKKGLPNTPSITPAPKSDQGEQQLNALKHILLKELNLENSTINQSAILISDIPFPKQRDNKDGNKNQNLPNVVQNSSLENKDSSEKRKPIGEAQAVLANYTSFITNILKAAHLSVVNNLTGDATNSPGRSKAKLHQPSGELTNTPKRNNSNGQLPNQELSFANSAQEQSQEHHQLVETPVLSKERVEARKAFGTAQKLVKAFMARQELYRAEKEFFKKIHEMLNKSSFQTPQSDVSPKDDQESAARRQPTSPVPMQSPVGQVSPNPAGSSTVAGDGKPKPVSEAEKKFEEAAHLEEKVAAQQDDMYDALMGHSIGKDYGGFDEEGTTRDIPEQDGVEDAYNMEDYGDFKDSDEEAERKFYHNHRQGDFGSKTVEENTFSLRNKIGTIPDVQLSNIKELSGNGSTFEMSGDSKEKNKDGA